MPHKGGDSESGEGPDSDPPPPAASNTTTAGAQPAVGNPNPSSASLSSASSSSSASLSSSLPASESPASASPSSSSSNPKHSLSTLLGAILGALFGALLLLAVALLLYRRHRRRQARAEQRRREHEMRLAQHIDPLVAAPDLRLALEVPLSARADARTHTHWDNKAGGFGWPAGQYVARDSLSFSSTSGTSTSPSSPTSLPVRYSYTAPAPMTSSVRESLTVAGGIDANRPPPARPQVPSQAAADASADADEPMTPMDTLMRELDYSAHIRLPVPAERAFASTSTAQPPEYIE